MCAGSLNAWILLSGQIAKTAAIDRILPKSFAKENKYGSPVISVAISSIGTILILLLQHFVGNKVGEFIDMSVVVYIMLYVTTVVACAKFAHANNNVTYTIISMIAFVFCLCVLLFSPISRFLFIICVLCAGIPVYAYMRKQWK